MFSVVVAVGLHMLRTGCGRRRGGFERGRPGDGEVPQGRRGIRQQRV